MAAALTSASMAEPGMNAPGSVHEAAREMHIREVKAPERRRRSARMGTPIPGATL